MRHVHLGNSGLKISEIIYGNWLTHASQVENEQARRCVSAALDAGITTFDTADTYANTQAEVVLGEACWATPRITGNPHQGVLANWPHGSQ